jgi:hypothetical protein
MARMRAQELAEELGEILEDEVRHGKDSSRVWSPYGTFTVHPGADAPYVSLSNSYHLPSVVVVAVARLLAEYEA